MITLTKARYSDDIEKDKREMIQVTFTLRTLTPLFLAGADQSQAELRAPAFRGLMRYWLRALVGGIVGTDNDGLKIVSEQEMNVFGATDTKSAITIRVSAASREAKEFTEPISKRVGTRWQATGKGYLLWSMAKSGRADKGNLKPARWYFPSETSFQVTLSSPGQDDTRMQQAITAFWLLTYLGAIGSRSHRCAGSLEVKEVTTPANYIQIPGISFQTASSINELQRQIEQGIQAARGLYTQKLPARQVRRASFDILAPNVCRIWLLQEKQVWSNPEAAMQALGSSLQTYRSSLPLSSRTIFGLPLMGVDNRSRRASPLLLRIAELKGGTFVGIAVLFQTDSYQNYMLIENWANTFSGKVEVTF